jgi:hypothetical protein
VSKDKLERGNLIEYEGVVFVDPSPTEKNTNSWLEVSTIIRRPLLFSESSVEKAHIGIRFSVGKNKDDGLERDESIDDIGDLDDSNDDSNRDVFESMDIHQLSNLKLNDTLNRVNQEFERNFVQNSFYTANNELIQPGRESAITQKKDLSQSQLSQTRNLKRPNEEPVSREHNKSPRPGSLQLPENSTRPQHKEMQNEDSGNPMIIQKRITSTEQVSMGLEFPTTPPTQSQIKYTSPDTPLDTNPALLQVANKNADDNTTPYYQQWNRGLYYHLHFCSQPGVTPDLYLTECLVMYI